MALIHVRGLDGREVAVEVSPGQLGKDLKAAVEAQLKGSYRLFAQVIEGFQDQ